MDNCVTGIKKSPNYNGEFTSSPPMLNLDPVDRDRRSEIVGKQHSKADERDFKSESEAEPTTPRVTPATETSLINFPTTTSTSGMNGHRRKHLTPMRYSQKLRSRLSRNRSSSSSSQPSQPQSRTMLDISDTSDDEIEIMHFSPSGGHEIGTSQKMQTQNQPPQRSRHLEPLKRKIVSKSPRQNKNIKETEVPLITPDDSDDFKPKRRHNGAFKSQKDYINRTRDYLNQCLDTFQEKFRSDKSSLTEDTVNESIAKCREAWKEAEKLDEKDHKNLREVVGWTEKIIKNSSPKEGLESVELMTKLLSPACVKDFSESFEKEASLAAKKKKHLKKIEARMKKTDLEITKLRMKEVDVMNVNDENEKLTAYNKLGEKIEWSIKRMVEIKRSNDCEDFKTGRPTEAPIKLEAIGASTQSKDIDSAIEKMFKKGQESDPLFLPNFFEICTVVKKVNEQKNRCLSSKKLGSIAEVLLEKITKERKQRREQDESENSWCARACAEEGMKKASTANDSASTSLLNGYSFADYEDPAENDPELQKALEENSKLRKYEATVFNEFTRMQMKMQEEQGLQSEPDDVVDDDEDLNQSESELVNEEEYFIGEIYED